MPWRKFTIAKVSFGNPFTWRHHRKSPTKAIWVGSDWRLLLVATAINASSNSSTMFSTNRKLKALTNWFSMPTAFEATTKRDTRSAKAFNLLPKWFIKFYSFCASSVAACLCRFWEFSTWSEFLRMKRVELRQFAAGGNAVQQSAIDKTCGRVINARESWRGNGKVKKQQIESESCIGLHVLCAHSIQLFMLGRQTFIGCMKVVSGALVDYSCIHLHN